MNKVDKEALELLLRAKKKYHNLRVGVVEYSPIFLKARLK